MSESQPKVKKPRGKARLLENKCIACGARCQSVCPANAVEMNDAGEPIVHSGKVHRLRQMRQDLSGRRPGDVLHP